MNSVEKIYIFKRFERFWHWSQAALIVFMGFTGFEIHGLYSFYGFEDAVSYHTTTAWVLIGLWVFAIFWHLTTGEWRQYIPTTQRMVAMAQFYAIGIFTDAPHPFRVTARRKHNPLQRLAYLSLWVLINPAIWISGLLYLYFNSWSEWGLDFLNVEIVAFVHTAAAFLITAFFVGHVYLVTTGHTVFAQIKAMITGWEEVEEDH